MEGPAAADEARKWDEQRQASAAAMTDSLKGVSRTSSPLQPMHVGAGFWESVALACQCYAAPGNGRLAGLRHPAVDKVATCLYKTLRDFYAYIESVCVSSVCACSPRYW